MQVLSSTTISIGRNIGNDQQLSAGDWYLFRRQIKRMIQEAGGVIVADTTGSGVYDGIKEESAVFIALNVNKIEQLKKQIAQILPVYKQECAGFGLDLMPDLIEARAMVTV